MSLVVGALQVAAMVALPLVVAAHLVRRWRLSWRLFGVGALGFVGSQVVHVPLLFLPKPDPAASPWAFALWLGFLAGLCEETARYLVFRRVLTDARSFRQGVLVGVGHGGIESALLGLLVGAGLLQAAKIPPDAAPMVRAVVDAMLGASPWLRVAAVAERGMAMLAHVALSLLVMSAMRRQALARWGLAVVLHAAMDAIAVRSSMVFGPYVTELFVACLALFAVAFIAFEAIRSRGLAPPPPVPASEAAIECRGLGRRFDDVVAVEALDLKVPRGHCYALLGPNGAGKTTTVRMLCALIAPTSGGASVAGCELGRDDDALHARIGILTEVPGLYERLSAVENLEFFARVHGLDPARATRQIHVLLRDLDLFDRRHDAISTYSKGMKQKLAVIRALLHDPEVLFLDEPTSGLDPEAAFELRERIQALKRQGRTVFLTTHRLEEAEELADSVGIFNGRLLASGTVSELRRRVARPKLTLRFAELLPEHSDLVRAVDGAESVEVFPERSEISVTLDDPDEATPRIVEELVVAGARIRAVIPVEASLEDAYLALIKEDA